MIEIINVNAGYGKGDVLRGLSACFEKNAITSIIGPNGCGKSTLLKTVIGIVARSQGQILIDGNEISNLRRKDIAKKVAYLAQAKNAPDMTVAQMVLQGRFAHLDYPERYSDIDRRHALEAMERVEIAHLSDKPIETLSGGIRQKAYIAMALAQDAEYLLLDEPTTYLDVSNQSEVMRLLGDLAGDGRGIVSVMHDIPLALTFSDKVVIMKEGKAEFCGTPANAVSSGTIERVFGVEVQHSGNGYFYKY
ncbi:MAG: ABC transporter ATP-binding protein [Ruminococcaceae bacterium]|nr:ABC transporter ATP-binding protein [Oscillospiraceae bacterium]